MVYGVVISQDSFVFTRDGVIAVKALQDTAEVLGVSGVSNCTTFQKVELSSQMSPISSKAKRIITQATDSIVLQDTLIFSETIKNANEILSGKEIEFFNPKKLPFSSGNHRKISLKSEEAYAIGLLSNPVYNERELTVFLLRNAETKRFQSLISEALTTLIENRGIKIDFKVKNGQLGHSWITIKGRQVEQVAKLLSSVSPLDACFTLEVEPLKYYIAGMLDARISNPLYGGNPLVTFLNHETMQKRFLNNALLLFDSNVVETSCITSYSPKILGTSNMLSNIIPVINPAWEKIESLKSLNLFSKIRGVESVKTESKSMVFNEQGFSPIVDCLYTCPCV